MNITYFINFYPTNHKIVAHDGMFEMTKLGHRVKVVAVWGGEKDRIKDLPFEVTYLKDKIDSIKLIKQFIQNPLKSIKHYFYLKKYFGIIDSLNFSTLIGGDIYFKNSSIQIFNRTTGLYELSSYLNAPNNKPPPYIFILYHSYEINNEIDFQNLDYSLKKLNQRNNIKFIKVSEFLKNYGKQVDELENLNLELKFDMLKVWKNTYIANHLLRLFKFNIQQQIFMDLNYSLMLKDFHQIKIQLNKIEKYLYIVFFTHILLYYIIIIVLFHIYNLLIKKMENK